MQGRLFCAAPSGEGVKGGGPWRMRAVDGRQGVNSALYAAWIIEAFHALG